VERHKGVIQRAFSRGIYVDPNWIGNKGKENFVRWSLENGYRKELQIDRIEPSKGYSPKNCQYLNSYENNVKDRRNYLFNGIRCTLKELHKLSGSTVSYKTFIIRKSRGWEIDEALKIPANKGNKWRK
jgi:hypothetical protein